MHEKEAYLQTLLYCRKFPYEHAIDTILTLFSAILVRIVVKYGSLKNAFQSDSAGTIPKLEPNRGKSGDISNKM